MKKFVVSMLSLVAVLSIVHAQTPARKPRILVAYYSRTGNTREIAHQIRSLVGGDIFEIQTLVPYPADYEAIKQKAMEEQEAGYKPALKSKVRNFGSYDIIFVGSPVWWATLPPPVSSFLSEYDFKGKDDRALLHAPRQWPGAHDFCHHGAVPRFDNPHGHRHSR